MGQKNAHALSVRATGAINGVIVTVQNEYPSQIPNRKSQVGGDLPLCKYHLCMGKKHRTVIRCWKQRAAQFSGRFQLISERYI